MARLTAHGDSLLTLALGGLCELDLLSIKLILGGRDCALLTKLEHVIIQLAADQSVPLALVDSFYQMLVQHSPSLLGLTLMWPPDSSSAALQRRYWPSLRGCLRRFPRLRYAAVRSTRGDVSLERYLDHQSIGAVLAEREGTVPYIYAPDCVVN